MDEYDFSEEPKLNVVSLILNILTGLVLLTTLCIGGYFLLVFFNPTSGLNPFPPTPFPTLAPPPTATPVAAQQLPPTRTAIPPTATILPTETHTPGPTREPSATPTQFVLISLTPVPVTEELDTSGASFELKGEPLAMPNFAYQDRGCDFLGVAGHAYDLSGGVVVMGYYIELEGWLGGQYVNELTLPGLTNRYGDGGFEFTLADRPIASTGTLSLQLLDQTGAFALSEKVYFNTFEDCEKNLILVDFQQFR